MPKPYDIYERLAREHAKPRQYSGYSSGAASAPAGPGFGKPNRAVEAMEDIKDQRKMMLGGVDYNVRSSDPEYNFAPHIADMARQQQIPMPQPAGPGKTYTPEQYTDLVGQYYSAPPDAEARRQSFLNQFRASMQGGMPAPNAPPALPQMNGYSAAMNPQAAPTMPVGMGRQNVGYITGAELMPGAQPILSAGMNYGRDDYAPTVRDYGPPMPPQEYGPEQPGMLNALRARLGF